MIIEHVVFFQCIGLIFCCFLHKRVCQKYKSDQMLPALQLFIKMESPAEPALNFEIISVTIYQVLDLQTETLLRMITIMNFS